MRILLFAASLFVLFYTNGLTQTVPMVGSQIAISTTNVTSGFVLRSGNDALMKISTNMTEAVKRTTIITVAKGLADSANSNSVSFLQDELYLTYSPDGICQFSNFVNSDDFKNRSTFKIVNGIYPIASAVSLQSYFEPTKYIRHQNGVLKVNDAPVLPQNDWATKDFIWQIMPPILKDENLLKTQIAAHNIAVHVMDDWMRDPYIVLASDNKYYLTVTQFENAAKGLGFPMWRSDDLSTWEYVGIPYTLKNCSFYNNYLALSSEANLKLWAPELHFVKNRAVVVHTSNTGLGNIAISNDSTFAAPFSDWGSGGFGKRHDPSIFVDTDNSAWLVYGATNIIKIKDDLSGFSGSAIAINPSNRKIGHEGCEIIKIENKYVLFGTGWSTDIMRYGTYNLYYCTADNITGPYSERKFAGRCLGHGTIFKDKQNRWWCSAFLNGDYLSADFVANNTIPAGAATSMNPQGLTLVPMDISIKNGDVVVKALDPRYANPGSEEVQKFTPVASANIRSNNSISVFPNPATNQITIVNAPTVSNIQLINAQGKVVLTTDNPIVNVKNIARGIYLLTVNKQYYKKIILK